MKIRNRRNFAVTLNYAGATWPPLKLEPEAVSRELPDMVANDGHFKSDLASGFIEVVTEAQPKPAARPGPQSQVPPPPARVVQEPQVVAGPPQKRQREDSDKPLVDLVANELAVKLMMLKPEERERVIADYKRSGNPNFVNAVKEAERRVLAQAAAPKPERISPALVVPEAIPAAISAVVDYTKSVISRPEGPLAPSNILPPEDMTGAPKDPLTVSPLAVTAPETADETMSRKQLYELAKSRGLGPTSKMNVKALTELLMRG